MSNIERSRLNSIFFLKKMLSKFNAAISKLKWLNWYELKSRFTHALVGHLTGLQYIAISVLSAKFVWTTVSSLEDNLKVL